jgi:uncharacterized protein YlaN (UPF0358 family)
MIIGSEGIAVTANMAVENQQALELLRSDAAKIHQLIRVQLENLTMPQCPLYEEVLDTQMFGLSREIDFAVRLGLIHKETGKAILSQLEMELTHLYDAFEKLKQTE